MDCAISKIGFFVKNFGHHIRNQSGNGLLQVVIYSSILCVVSMAMIASLINYISLESKASSYVDADATKILLMQVLNNPTLCKDAMKNTTGGTLTIKRDSAVPIKLSYITDSPVIAVGSSPNKIIQANRDFRGVSWKDITLTQIIANGTAPTSGADTFSVNMKVEAEVGIVNGISMIGGSKTVDWDILISITADVSSGAIQSCTILPSVTFASTSTAGAWLDCGDGRFGQTAPAAGVTCNDVCTISGKTCQYRGTQAGYSACVPSPTFPIGNCTDVFAADWSSQCVCN